MSSNKVLFQQVLKKANRVLDALERNKKDFDTGCPSHVHTLRWSNTHGAQAIAWNNSMLPNDLLHVELQAKLLFDNTQQFVKQLPANNALLWGSRGTGKSSLLQSTLGAFFSQGLRVLEITRDNFQDWPQIVAWIQQQQEPFILFCDDLSFNANDDSYQAIKAALDGSFSALPENALLYASSNRRHLLPEKMTDNANARHVEGEVHHAEAVEEAISLSDRFGLWLAFHPFKQDEYLDIVHHWLQTFGVIQERQQYREQALRWALQRGSRSGRIANQFARHYAGQHLLNNSK